MASKRPVVNYSGVPGTIQAGDAMNLAPIASSLLKTDASGNVVGAAAGTDYLTPTGSAAGLTGLTAAQIPTTGLTVTQHTGPVTTDADAATVTFNLAASDWHQVQLGGNRTLALSNPTVGQQFSLILQQDATGSRTVTWFAGVLWPGGTAPTLTTAANKRDVFTFKCVAAGVYLGFTAGLNL